MKIYYYPLIVYQHLPQSQLFMNSAYFLIICLVFVVYTKLIHVKVNQNTTQILTDQQQALFQDNHQPFQKNHIFTTIKLSDLNKQNINTALILERNANQPNFLISQISNNPTYLKILIAIALTLILTPSFYFIFLMINLVYYREVNSIQQSQQILLDLQYDEKRDYCAICLMEDCDLILECNHYFHKNCFQDWIAIQQICPICRSDKIKFIKIMVCKILKNKCEIIKEPELKAFKNKKNCYYI